MQVTENTPQRCAARMVVCESGPDSPFVTKQCDRLARRTAPYCEEHVSLIDIAQSPLSKPVEKPIKKRVISGQTSRFIE